MVMPSLLFLHQTICLSIASPKSSNSQTNNPTTSTMECGHDIWRTWAMLWYFHIGPGLVLWVKRGLAKLNRNYLAIRKWPKDWEASTHLTRSHGSSNWWRRFKVPSQHWRVSPFPHLPHKRIGIGPIFSLAQVTRLRGSLGLPSTLLRWAITIARSLSVASSRNSRQPFKSWTWRMMLWGNDLIPSNMMSRRLRKVTKDDLLLVADDVVVYDLSLRGLVSKKAESKN